MTFAIWEAVTAAATVAIAALTFWMARAQIKAARDVARLEIALRLIKEFESDRMWSIRDQLARTFLTQGTAPGHLADALLEFFEDVGYLTRKGLVDRQLIYSHFCDAVTCYWFDLAAHVQSSRREFMSEQIFEAAKWLNDLMLEESKTREDGSPTGSSRARFYRTETSPRRD